MKPLPQQLIFLFKELLSLLWDSNPYFALQQTGCKCASLLSYHRFRCFWKFYPFKRIVWTASSGHSAAETNFFRSTAFYAKERFCFNNTNLQPMCAIYLHSKNYFAIFIKIFQITRFANYWLEVVWLLFFIIYYLLFSRISC